MHQLRHWLDATRSRISGRSDLAAAIRCSLSRWDALTLILPGGSSMHRQLGGRARHAPDNGQLGRRTPPPQTLRPDKDLDTLWEITLTTVV